MSYILSVNIAVIIALAIQLMSASALAEDSDYFGLELHELALQTVSDSEVVAQKKSEEASLVPISLSIVGQADLQQGHIQNLHDLSWYVSNLTVSQYNFLTPQLYIRGIGSNLSGAGDDPSTSLMMDGVGILRAGFFDQPMFDMDRVEVIRGPLGTLYGNTAIGGMIHLRSQGVASRPEQWIKAGVGNQNSKLITAVNNQEGWIGDWQRTSFYYESNDGYLKNKATGNNLGDKNRLAIRHQMKWSKADVVLYFNKEDQLGPALQYGGNDPSLTSVFLFPNDKNNTWSSVDGFEDRQFAYVVVKNTGVFSSWDWHSQLIIQSGDYEYFQDTTPSSLTLFSNSAKETANSIGYEWRIAKSINSHNIRVEALAEYKIIDRHEVYDTRGLIGLLGLSGAITEDAPAIDEFDTENTVGSLAFVAEDDWALLDNLRLIFGLRLDYVEKDFDLTFEGGEPFNLFTNVEDYSLNNQSDWTEPSYRMVLGYQPSKQQMMYANVSTGFKAGSLNSIPLQRSDAESSSKAETSINYELGYKLALPNSGMQLSLSGFFTDYQELQIVSGFDSSLNAAKAESKGGELQVEWKPLNNWRLNAGYHYLDASFSDWRKANGDDFTGNDLARAPQESFNIISNLVYSFSKYHITWNALLSHESGMYFDDSNLEAIRAPSKTIFNSSLTLYNAQSDWEVSMWGKNLLDENYRVFGQIISAQLSPMADIHTKGPSRSIGFDIVWFL